MTLEKTTKNDPVLYLCSYWLRAKYMHDLMQWMREEIGIIELDSAEGTEFMTYLEFWLAALFVTVEGYNRLRLRNSKIDALIKENIKGLKELRDTIYHYDHDYGRRGNPFFDDDGINWAMELHDAFYDLFRQYTSDVEQDGKVIQANKKRPGKKRPRP